MVDLVFTLGPFRCAHSDPGQIGRRGLGCQRGHGHPYLRGGRLYLADCVCHAPARQFSGTFRRNWLFLVLSGLATGLSWLCYFRALQAGSASRVAPIDKLSVALVILLAALFLGERLTWSKGVGGLLIVAGAITIALE